VAKKPSTSREELLQGVISYLAENGVAHATFRSLAARLGISPYPLVYYFGSKEQLLNAVVAEVERRQREYADRGLEGNDPLAYWQWCTENRDLLRLDLEILLHEGRRSGHGALADLVFRDWHRAWVGRLTAVGLTPEQAELQATLTVALGVGLQVDLVATGDVERITRAFGVQHEQLMELLYSDAAREAGGIR
jgi:AcrR family transcriptional regulator